jgi:hypothetical protein
MTIFYALGQRIVLRHHFLESGLPLVQSHRYSLYAETFPMHRRHMLVRTGEEDRSRLRLQRPNHPSASVSTMHPLRPCLLVRRTIDHRPILSSRSLQGPSLSQNQDHLQGREESRMFRPQRFPRQRHTARPEPMPSSAATSPRPTAHTPARSNHYPPRTRS